MTVKLMYIWLECTVKNQLINNQINEKVINNDIVKFIVVPFNNNMLLLLLLYYYTIN